MTDYRILLAAFVLGAGIALGGEISHLACPSFKVHEIRCRDDAQSHSSWPCFDGERSGNWYHAGFDPRHTKAAEEFRRWDQHRWIHHIGKWGDWSQEPAKGQP